MPTKKQQACVTRYVAKHYDQIRLNVKKGERDKYKQAAERLGISLNELFVRAAEAYLADKLK